MEFSKNIERIYNEAKSKNAISKEDALVLADENETPLDELLYCSNLLRKNFDNNITVCAIINARSGKCSENCKFCAQSAHYNTEFESYPLVSNDDIIKATTTAKENGLTYFSVVTSGKGGDDTKDFKKILERIKALTSVDGIRHCASLGLLTLEQAKALKAAGLTRYHHNLETSRKHFATVCTTHSYDDRLKTISNATKAGIDVCSGGIFGMGETWEDRIDMAIDLKSANVKSIPLNFLYAIEGTPFADTLPLTPSEILRIVAVYRFIHPLADIKICGGREANLREVQCKLFSAGASGMMVGNYLVTSGRNIISDKQMLSDLNLKIN